MAVLLALCRKLPNVAPPFRHRGKPQEWPGESQSQERQVSEELNDTAVDEMCRGELEPNRHSSRCAGEAKLGVVKSCKQRYIHR